MNKEKQIVTRVGVIGTAGRKDDAAKLTREVYTQAFGSLCRFLSDIHRANPVNGLQLVSGGAAGADHLAVQFFILQLIPCSLKLYLPCEFYDEVFFDNGSHDLRCNPGNTMNYYHEKFSKNFELNTRKELAYAIQQGAEVEYGGGLFGRNTKVAKNSDAIIAFTFGNKECVKDGGTKDTVIKFLKESPKELLYHVDLHTPEIIHHPGEVEPQIVV